MNFVTEYGLKKEIKKALAENENQPRKTVGFQQAKQIGIVFLVHKDWEAGQVNKLAEMLKKQGKEVSLFTFFEDKDVDLFHFDFEYMTSSEISFWGKPKSHRLEKFVKKNFDYLIFTGKFYHPIIDYTFAKSHAKCRVGHSMEGKEAFFELMLGVSEQEDLDKFNEYLMMYLQRISV